MLMGDSTPIETIFYSHRVLFEEEEFEDSFDSLLKEKIRYVQAQRGHFDIGRTSLFPYFLEHVKASLLSEMVVGEICLRTADLRVHLVSIVADYQNRLASVNHSSFIAIEIRIIIAPI